MTARDWTRTFAEWSRSLSRTEKDKCARARRMVQKAIAREPRLEPFRPTVFVQGSYANKTNVRGASDIDFCVCSELFDLENAGLVSKLLPFGGGFDYWSFRKLVARALAREFDVIRAGRKALRIDASSVRVKADVIACSRLLTRRGDIGIVFWTRRGQRIESWPEQHTESIEDKDTATRWRYRRVVRILKHVRDDLERTMPSYFLECLLWNVPDPLFARYRSMYDTVIASIDHCITETSTRRCSSWLHASKKNRLFAADSRWSPPWARDFFQAAWRYLT